VIERWGGKKRKRYGRTGPIDERGDGGTWLNFGSRREKKS